MRQGYTPIFRNTLTSRIWALPDAQLRVWLWMQLHCDPEGFVCADLAGVAIAARVSASDAREALEVLALPDADADPEDPYEGRIIERVPKGWRVLGFEQQRELCKRETRNARNRRYMQNARAAAAANDVVADVAPVSPAKTGVAPTTTTLTTKPFPSEDRGESPAPAPIEASGTRTVWKDLKGWAMSPSLRSEAVMAGVPKDDIDGYLKRLGNGPIGGSRGVFDRDDYVREMFGKWRTWSEIERAKAPTSVTKTPSKLGADGMPPWVRKEHREYAKTHGLDLKALAVRFNREHHVPPRCMSPGDAAKDFTQFLRLRSQEAA